MNDLSGTLSGFSKVLRMMLQSAVLGLGAYLTIQGDLTAGAIIAASVASARALAPIDLSISHWKSLVITRKSYTRLKETLKALENDANIVQLPDPEQSLHVENITIAAPSTGAVVVSDVSFTLHKGQALGVIGETGGGKNLTCQSIDRCMAFASRLCTVG